MSPAVGRGAWAVAILVPLAALVLLLAAPDLDAVWEDHPAHFWLVLVAAVTSLALAVATSDAARRRRDARLFLVSLAFLTAAGFLALHALATPGVLLDTPNTGFVVATPVGLLVASLFAAASALELRPQTSLALMRHTRLVVVATLAAMGVWAALSLGEVGPLNDPLPEEEARGWLLGFAIPGVALYAFAAVSYLRLFLRRPAALPLSVASAYLLLAEAMVAIAAARNWHASWWEWHLLMLLAFGLVAVSARREWRDERFADLYLDATADAVRDVSVVFADQEGYTAFAERAGEQETAHMLKEYFDRMLPVARSFGGEMSQQGDALMASFNMHGDQPDHPERAVRAALALQREATAIAREHPDWPRFRAGVNTGPARTGVVGGDFTPLGDTVNLASRLEGQAQTGQVIVGGETYRRLPDGTSVETVTALRIKGKEGPVEAYVVLALPAVGDQSGERLYAENEEPNDERGAR